MEQMAEQVAGSHYQRLHHMALVMIALMFLAKERLAHREITASMLSCHDLRLLTITPD